MNFNFQFILVKQILSKYLDLQSLNLGCEYNYNIVKIDIDKDMNGVLYFSEEGGLDFKADKELLEKLKYLNKKVELINYIRRAPNNVNIVVSDKDCKVKFRKVEGIDSVAVLMGDSSALLATPVSKYINDYDVFSLIKLFDKYEEQRTLPDLLDSKIKAIGVDDFFFD